MKKSLVTRMTGTLRAFHRDQQGATLIEYILIIAAIALPLLGVIIIFRNRIQDFIYDAWQDITGEEELGGE